MGKLAFIITDTKSHKTFDILESRKANYLKKYFYRFPRQQRLNVKFIIINLFGTYYDLFKSIFPNATIISDRFHIVAQAINAFKCIKRIAFGYKSFCNFKTRILLITGIYKLA